ncbi:VOC family protein [Kaistia dalseonensis]|uniref:Glyoxalase-like domain-containing protein n=1 Tax=Kaistia dalseonensis TaxID=410840 RepID=A0ABU0HAB0_9HYPH|nr:VOC family protein [Kaistia dalseonensis]MCX5495833.1 VOC family protein [Kaistia dalseonensis]MDQ0438434.1 hypothetical protein [Kaistia dalseonensis]
MARLKEIVIDADHPAALARFWEQVADGYAVRPYDEAEIRRLAGVGLSPETDPVVMVDGPGPTLCFHLRRGPRPERNRIHLDLSTPDREMEVQRLLKLGATIFRIEDAFTTLRDPEGNQFCIVELAEHDA